MFSKKINDLYLKCFHLICSLCHEPYNVGINVPYVICFRQHYCCSACVQITLFKDGQTDSSCPECRQPINRNRISKLRLFKNMQEYHYSMISKCTKFESQNQKLVEDLNHTIQSILQNQENSNAQPKQEFYSKKGFKQKCTKYQKILLEQAQEYFLQNNFQKAIAICRKIIQVDSSLSAVYQGLGGKQDFIGYDQQYIKQYYKVYKLQKKQRSPYDLLSLSLLLSSDYQQDKNWYEKQLLSYPNHYQLRFGLGLLCSNFDKRQQAIQHFQIVRKINNDFEKADKCIAFEYYSQGDLQNAREYALYCLYKNPENIYSLFIKAMTNQDDQMIINELLELIDRSTQYLVPIHQLGQIYFNKNQYGKAIKCFQQCLQKSKYYNSSRISLSRCFIETKEYSKAIDLLNQPIIKQQEDQQIFMILAMAHLKLSQAQQSHEQIVKCKAHFPNNHKIDYILADVYALEQQYDLSIQTYKKLLEKDKQNYQIIKLIALVFLKKGDPYNANQWMEQYRLYQPQDIQLCCKFAHTFFQNNQKNEALRLYLQILLKNQQALQAYPKVIDIYNEKHMYEQSLHWAKKWSEVEPENVQSWESISSISKTIGTMIKNNEWKPKKRRHGE